MATHTSIVITPANTSKESSVDYSPLLLLSLATVATYQYSKKQMRKAQKKMAWQLLKMKLKNMFSFKKQKSKASWAKLILILLGLGFIVAIGIFLEWGIAIGILVVCGLVGIVYAGKD